MNFKLYSISEMTERVLNARSDFEQERGDTPNRLRISTDLVPFFSEWLGGYCGETFDERPRVVVATMIVVEDPTLPSNCMHAERYSGSGISPSFTPPHQQLHFGVSTLGGGGGGHAHAHNASGGGAMGHNAYGEMYYSSAPMFTSAGYGGQSFPKPPTPTPAPSPVLLPPMVVTDGSDERLIHLEDDKTKKEKT